ncbi:transposase [Candidatus Poribacteria bacterium]|nr:transposase [Candidatus Poribacteria bacterium]
MYTTLYKLFRAPRNRNLKRKTWIAHTIWNYFLGWQRTRYALGLPYLSYKEMSREFTILRKSHPDMFAHWRELDSWAARQVLKRLDEGYQRLFKKIAKRPPKFRSFRKPYSFTMCPSGYKFADPVAGDKGFGIYNDHVTIMGRTYRFNLSRPIFGNIKTVTIKEDALGDFYMSVVTNHVQSHIKPMTGHAAGFDMGIKTMLTCSNGRPYESPHFYTESVNEVRTANRQLSTKQRGSQNRERARQHHARMHRKVRQREDHHWKLALELVRRFDVLFFETLNLDGMKRLWGRKVSDIGFYAFLEKVKWQAKKRGKRVECIDQWQPTTPICHVCDTCVSLELSDRTWTCEHCNTHHDRDFNAAINILKVGASTFGVENVRLAIASCP